MEIARFETNPLLTTSECVGSIVNHPSVIRVPSWVEDPLGRYYCYFSHKFGDYIRLAYADALEGPWEIYEPGALHLAETPFTGHVASPDVHVDEENRCIRMYVHGETRVRDLLRGSPVERPYRRERHDYTRWSIPHRLAYTWGRSLFNRYEAMRAGTNDRGGSDGSGEGGDGSATTEEHSTLKKFLRKRSPRPSAVQETRQVESSDGLDFHSSSPVLGPSWFAVFTHMNRWYALARDGWVYASDTPNRPFERQMHLFEEHRHFGVDVSGDRLDIYFSRPRDEPESILRTSVDLDRDPTEWETTDVEAVLTPEQDYEGGDVDSESSRNAGPSDRRRELRDPDIFVEDGDRYLFYAAGGQSAIAAASILE